MIGNHGLLPTPDGMGYFTYNPARKTYIEVITFDKLVRDARQRNLVLFKNLGIERRLAKPDSAVVSRAATDHLENSSQIQVAIHPK